MLRWFFIEGIDVSIRSTVHPLWSDSREEIVKDLAHYVWSVLDVKSRQQKFARKEEGAWTEVKRHSMKEPKERWKPRHIMAVKSTGSKSTSKKQAR